MFSSDGTRTEPSRGRGSRYDQTFFKSGDKEDRMAFGKRNWCLERYVFEIAIEIIVLTLASTDKSRAFTGK